MTRLPEIRISHDSQTWAAAAAELVHAVGQEAVRANGQFLIALSGGTTPETLYRTLASPAFADRFDWSRSIVWQRNPVTQRRRLMSMNSNCVLLQKPHHRPSHPLISSS